MNETVELEELEEQIKPSEFYHEGLHSTSVSFVKLLLMPFVFFAMLGFPTAYGNYISVVSGFAAAAFFIFCGFFTLAPDQKVRHEKIGRALKRSWILFAVLFVFYLALNVAYFAYMGALKQLFSPELLRLRVFFNFLVLNVWPLPVGSGIWFIQSLAYAYLFFFLAEKLKLSKFYLPLLIVLLVAMLLCGEFAKIVGFPYFGFPYIPGGVFTKAIPFMLIGMFLRKGIDKLARIPWFVYLITFFLGIGITVGEFSLLARLGLLVYTGNAIGHAVMAISLCCLALTKPDAVDNFLGEHGESYAFRMYAHCQPIDFLLWFVLLELFPEYVAMLTEYRGLIGLAVCFILAFLIGLIKFVLLAARQQNLAEAEDEDEEDEAEQES